MHLILSGICRWCKLVELSQLQCVTQVCTSKEADPSLLLLDFDVLPWRTARSKKRKERITHLCLVALHLVKIILPKRQFWQCRYMISGFTQVVGYLVLSTLLLDSTKCKWE